MLRRVKRSTNNGLCPRTVGEARTPLRRQLGWRFAGDTGVSGQIGRAGGLAGVVL